MIKEMKASLIMNYDFFMSMTYFRKLQGTWIWDIKSNTWVGKYDQNVMPHYVECRHNEEMTATIIDENLIDYVITIII